MYIWSTDANVSNVCMATKFLRSISTSGKFSFGTVNISHLLIVIILQSDCIMNKVAEDRNFVMEISPRRTEFLEESLVYNTG